MKALTFFSDQYNNAQSNAQPQWSGIYVCNATDFVFIPEASPVPANSAANMAAAIKKLIDGRGTRTTNVWIGTPGIGQGNFLSGITLSTLTSYLTSVYTNSSITASAYRSKIVGVYMNQESFYSSTSPIMDYNTGLNGTQQGNVQLKRMSDLGAWIKAGNLGSATGFLWIPYYGKGSDPAAVIKNIGYAAANFQIFDYCIIQPGVFFDQTTTVGNFDGIEYSLNANNVCYRNGPTAFAKASNTQIGFEMEYDASYANASSLFKQYTDALTGYRSTKHQVFYWGRPSTADPNYTAYITDEFKKINTWYCTQEDLDYVIANYYGAKAGDSDWDLAKNFDLNGDGIVNMIDLQIIQSYINYY